MSDDLFRTRNTTILADLGPLPEVRESNTETSWRMFVELQEQQGSGFQPTEPAALEAHSGGRPGRVTVDDVMVEARRLNRVCPKDSAWQQLWALLREAAGCEPPLPIVAPESLKTPQLVKRVRFRDQVEWAAQQGQLQVLFAFMQSLGEDDWSHMRG
jgi:hypothetical protein